jgi:hypothetical protein
VDSGNTFENWGVVVANAQWTVDSGQWTVDSGNAKLGFEYPGDDSGRGIIKRYPGF